MSDAQDTTVQGNTDAVVDDAALDSQPEGQGTDQPDGVGVEAQAGDDQQGTDGAAEVPESYTIPEGTDIEQSEIDYVSDLAKSMKLTNENAAKLVQGLRDHEKAKVDDAIEASKEVKQSMGDVAYGQMLSGAKAAYDVGGEPASELVKEFPYLGNHPKFISMLSNIHNALMAEDKTNVGDVNHRQQTKKTTAEKLFG